MGGGGPPQKKYSRDDFVYRSCNSCPPSFKGIFNYPYVKGSSPWIEKLTARALYGFVSIKNKINFGKLMAFDSVQNN